MTTEILTPEQRVSARALLRTRFFIFTHIGGLMIAISTLKPFFWEHNIAGGIILAASLIYDLRPTASKKLKRLLSLVCLLASTWVVINCIFHISIPEDIPLSVIKFSIVGAIVTQIGLSAARHEVKLMD